MFLELHLTDLGLAARGERIPALDEAASGPSAGSFETRAADDPALASRLLSTQVLDVPDAGPYASDAGARVRLAEQRIYEIVLDELRDEVESGEPAPLVYADVNAFVAAEGSVRVDPSSNGIVPTTRRPVPESGTRVAGQLYEDVPMAAAMLGQWALGAEGIAVSLDDTGERENNDILGEGAVVAVLDTLPDALSQGATDSFAAVDVDLARWDSTTASPTATLSAKSIQRADPHGIGFYPSLPAPLGTDPSRREHGMFSLGLVHAVAPDASLQLIRAANDHGESSVVNVVAALHWYLANESAFDPDAPGKELGDTVIDLPLGVRYPDDPTSIADSNAVKTTIASLIDVVEGIVADPNTDAERAAILEAYVDLIETNGDESFPALRAPIELARELDAVVVASAGNRPSWITTAVTEQLPASFDGVIGVVGTERSGQRSCLSATIVGGASEVVAAPAGFEEKNAATCSPGTKAEAVELAKKVHCADCAGLYVLGRVSPGVMASLHDVSTAPEHVHTPAAVDGFGYWTGTSWSAAFVAGAAALVRGCTGGDADAVTQEILDSLATPIPADPDLGQGILDVETLLDALPVCN